MAKFVIRVPDFTKCPSNPSCAQADEKQRGPTLHSAVLHRNAWANLLSTAPHHTLSARAVVVPAGTWTHAAASIHRAYCGLRPAMDAGVPTPGTLPRPPFRHCPCLGTLLQPPEQRVPRCGKRLSQPDFSPRQACYELRPVRVTSARVFLCVSVSLKRLS